MLLTDMTEHSTTEGKLYLCAIKDACSGQIVGYSMDSRMKASLAVAVAVAVAVVALRDHSSTSCSRMAPNLRSAPWSSGPRSETRSSTLAGLARAVA